jgi:DNA-binding response OmpR family regulator
MKKQILIVDDELDMCELLACHLDDGQTGLHCAHNGAEALALVRRVTPDLILLDVMLPDVDGLTLCEALRQMPGLRRVPIAMISAHDSAVTRRLAEAAGANEYFTKPFNLTAFKDAVRRLLASFPGHVEVSPVAAE